VQQAGGALVRQIEGDYTNVVGLPLALLLDVWPSLLDDVPAPPPPR
jgi:predicted house-cleaning NTP pyrophosphatase (Maf/HAM1 superfamily)